MVFVEPVSSESEGSEQGLGANPLAGKFGKENSTNKRYHNPNKRKTHKMQLRDALDLDAHEI